MLLSEMLRSEVQNGLHCQKNIGTPSKMSNKYSLSLAWLWQEEGIPMKFISLQDSCFKVEEIRQVLVSYETIVLHFKSTICVTRLGFYKPECSFMS